MTRTWKTLLSRLRGTGTARRSRPVLGLRRRERAFALERLEERALPAFQMHVATTSGFDLTITDGDGNDGNAAAGVISYVGGAGNFALTIDVGNSKPSIGSAASPHMTLSFNAVKLVG